MDRQRKPCRALQPVRNFDGNSISPSSSGSNSGEPVIQAGAVAIPNNKSAQVHLFHMAVLEYVCCLYEPDDPERSKAIYIQLCQRLSSMGMMNPLSTLDISAQVFAEYRKTFHFLMMSCMQPDVRQQNMSQRLQLIMQPRLPAITLVDGTRSEFIYPSRYTNEFTEIKRLGKGAYGSVFKVQHNLDNCEYAVKKVAFEGDSIEILEKILREAQILSRLSHQNIVRYYTAWLEPHTTTPVPSSDDNSSGSESLRRRAITHRSHSNRDTDSNPSIVFKDSLVEAENATNHPSVSSHSSSSWEARDLVPCMMLHIQMELCSDTLSDWLHHRNTRCAEEDDRYRKENPGKNFDVYPFVNEEHNIRILRHILQALVLIHGENFIHRDIKPKNIFLTYHSDGEFVVKLGDFGLIRPSCCDVPLTPSPGWPRASVREVVSPVKSPKREEQTNSTKPNVKTVTFQCESSEQEDTSTETDGCCDASSQHVTIEDCSDSPPHRSKCFRFRPEDCSSSSSPSRSDTSGSPRNLGSEHMENDLADLALQLKRGEWELLDTESLDAHHTSGVGTTSYAAPEQLGSSDYDHKADMYSVGVVMYELYQPFTTISQKADHFRELRKGVVHQNFRLKWPVIADVISNLVSTDCQARFSALELLDQLNTRQVSHGESGSEDLHIKELQRDVDGDEMREKMKALEEKVRAQENELQEKEKELQEKEKELQEKEKELQEKDRLIQELRNAQRKS